MDTLLLVLAGLLFGGAWSLRSQTAPAWLVILTVLAAAASLTAALVTG